MKNNCNNLKRMQSELSIPLTPPPLGGWTKDLKSLKIEEDIKNINKLKSEDINEKINLKEMGQASHPRGGGSGGSQTKCKSLFKILSNKKEQSL